MFTVPTHSQVNFRLLTKTETPDSIGGQTDTYAEDSTSDFVGKIDKLSGNESERESRRQYTATHRLFCDTSVSLTQSCRIRDIDNTTDYEVVSFESLAGHHIEAILEEQTN